MGVGGKVWTSTPEHRELLLSNAKEATVVLLRELHRLPTTAATEEAISKVTGLSKQVCALGEEPLSVSFTADVVKAAELWDVARLGATAGEDYDEEAGRLAFEWLIKAGNEWPALYNHWSPP